MKFSMKYLVTAVAVALASPAAFAIDSPSFGGATGVNGSLFITVFDQVKGASVVQALSHSTFAGGGAINYQEFLESLATPDAGLTLNFSVDMSVFTQVGSNLNDLKYTVFAGDSSGSATGGQGVMVTTNADPSAANTGQITGMNTQATSIASACGAAAVCTGTLFGSTYFGGTNWGDSFSSQLPVIGSAALDTSLNFYSLIKAGSGADTTATLVQYANVNGPATWLLDSLGNLTYSIAGGTSEVPLPAAVWLLLSGLGGLGVVGRRKPLAAAV